MTDLAPMLDVLCGPSRPAPQQITGPAAPHLPSAATGASRDPAANGSARVLAGRAESARPGSPQNEKVAALRRGGGEPRARRGCDR